MARPTRPRTIRPRTLTLLAFLAFVSLGLPDTLLGVAWPSMRHTFGLPLGDLGLILAPGAAGYLLSSFFGGEIVRRFGVGRLLVGSTVLVAVALAGNASAPLWPLLIGFAFISGLGAGAIDAGINTFAASRFSPRVVNWLHACWGIGASVSPLVMTAVIAGGQSWRIGYAILAAVMVMLVCVFIATRDAWTLDAASNGSEASAASMGEALRRPIILAQIGIYLLYGGIEASAGQWMFTLLTESRGFAIATAGTLVGVYWASVTAGRVLFGQLAAMVGALAIIRIGLCGAAGAVVLLWPGLPRAASGCGVVLLGFMLAPVFPTIMADTPRRVGARLASHAVGFQVAACALGIAAVPGTVGVMARTRGIEVLVPTLLVLIVGIIALHEAVAASVTRSTRDVSGEARYE